MGGLKGLLDHAQPMNLRNSSTFSMMCPGTTHETDADMAHAGRDGPDRHEPV